MIPDEEDTQNSKSLQRLERWSTALLVLGLAVDLIAFGIRVGRAEVGGDQPDFKGGM